MITWMKNVNNFQIAKNKPQDIAQHFLDFYQFQAGDPYNSVAYKKRRVI